MPEDKREDDLILLFMLILTLLIMTGLFPTRCNPTGNPLLDPVADIRGLNTPDCTLVEGEKQCVA